MSCQFVCDVCGRYESAELWYGPKGYTQPDDWYAVHVFNEPPKGLAERYDVCMNACLRSLQRQTPMGVSMRIHQVDGPVLTTQGTDSSPRAAAVGKEG